MKKLLSYIIVFMLIAAMCIPAMAFATNEGEAAAPEESASADPTPTAAPTPESTPAPTSAPTAEPTQQVIKKLSVSISASPNELVTGGNVTLNISVYNPNSFLVENIKISVDGSTQKSIKGLKGKDTYTYTGKYNVSTASLGKSIPVVVAYDGGSVSESFRIAQKAANVTVDTISKVDKQTLSAGESANFSFSIENKSDITISDVTLKASTLNDGNALLKGVTLAAGEAKIISYSQAISNTIDVAPVLTYTAAGKSYSKNLETLTVTVTDAEISLTATPDKTAAQANEDVTFTVNLKNTGNVDFTSIALYDSTDTRVTTASNQLSVGSSLSATHTMKFAASGVAEFYVVATDAAGTSYTFRSNSVAMDIAATGVSEYAAFFTLTATPEDDSIMLKKAGEVHIALTLSNLHTDAFTDITITERNSDTVVETYSVFPTGEKTLSYTAEIEQTTNFDFVLTATDPDGNPFEYTVPTVNIPVDAKASGSNKLMTLLIILGIVIVLIIGGSVALIVLIVKDKKKKKAAELQRSAAVSDRRSRSASATARRRPAATAAHTASPDAAHSPEAHQPTSRSTASPHHSAPTVHERPEHSSGSHKSYEHLKAEPAEEPMIVPPHFDDVQETEAYDEYEDAPISDPFEDTPQDSPVVHDPLFENADFTEESEEEEELELKPLPKRRHRDFEDRNQF